MLLKIILCLLFIYSEAESLWTGKLTLIAVKEKQVAGNFPGWLTSHLEAISCHICFLQVWLSQHSLFRNKSQLMKWPSEISWRWMGHSTVVWRPYSADQYLRYLIPDCASAQTSWKMSNCTECVGGVRRDHQGMPVSWHTKSIFGLTLKIYSLKIRISLHTL